MHTTFITWSASAKTSVFLENSYNIIIYQIYISIILADRCILFLCFFVFQTVHLQRIYTSSIAVENLSLTHDRSAKTDNFFCSVFSSKKIKLKKRHSGL